jgi:polysaccharide deacetylase 2 family uncharacterized protein YibQ
MEVLESWIPQAQQRGFDLVAVDSLIKQPGP